MQDSRLQAPEIAAGQLIVRAGSIDGEVVDPTAKIHFEAVKERTEWSASGGSSGFLWQHSGNHGSVEETLKLPSIVITPPGEEAGAAGHRSADNEGHEAANDHAPGGDGGMILQAPGGIVVSASALPATAREASETQSGGSGAPPPVVTYDLRQEAATLATRPGMAWLGELTQRDDVDWQKIELVRQQWDDGYDGLTREGAIVIAIVVTVLTWGSASGAGTAVVNATGSTRR